MQCLAQLSLGRLIGFITKNQKTHMHKSTDILAATVLAAGILSVGQSAFASNITTQTVTY